MRIEPTTTPQHVPARRSAYTGLAWGLAGVAAVAVTMYYDAPLKAFYDHYTNDHPLLEAAAIILTMVFALPTLALSALLLKMLDRRLKRRFYYEYCVVMLGQMFSSMILKQLVGRPRPNVTHGDPTVFYGPNVEHWNASFPSGHATASFAFAIILGAYYPRWRWLLYIIAVIVPFARVQMNRHYISDIMAGALLGTFVALWILRLLRRPRKPAGQDAPQEAAPDSVSEIAS